jgi:hypothetical protein
MATRCNPSDPNPLDLVERDLITRRSQPLQNTDSAGCKPPSVSSRREEGEIFFLTSPLIGLIEPPGTTGIPIVRVRAGSRATIPHSCKSCLADNPGFGVVNDKRDSPSNLSNGPQQLRSTSSYNCSSGNIDVVVQIGILEFSLGIKLLRESAEVFQTWVERCDLAAVRGEYLGPVRTCAKWSEFGLDLRQ